jgi:hypothetical protein
MRQRWLWVLCPFLGALTAPACSSTSSRDGAAGGGGGLDDPGVCPGFDPWAEGAQLCHRDDECTYGCSASADAEGCGACIGAQHQCRTDTDCGMGEVCNPFPFSPPCNCSADTEERRCIPVCPDTPCDDGFGCDGTGHCVPTPCDAGYTCPAGKVCGMAGDFDEHGCRTQHCSEGFACQPFEDCVATPSGTGCVPQPCGADADCPCGACVNGACAGRIGACYEPAA